MFTIALIGPDGAGKSTITHQLEKTLPLPVKYVYMGVNLESSNLVLPTTRLILELKRLGGGRPDMGGPPNPNKPRPKGMKRVFKEIKTSLRMLNLIAEEWYRQLVVWYYTRRGYVVLSDRHFFCDYYAHDFAGDSKKRPLANRLHGWMLDRWYPRPDLMICLDAPAEVLFARKGEGTVELLESRRQEYLNLQHVVPHFARVDVTQSIEEVTRQVADLIIDFYEAHSGKMVEVGGS